jgi:hypothetical protein
LCSVSFLGCYTSSGGVFVGGGGGGGGGKGRRALDSHLLTLILRRQSVGQPDCWRVRVTNHCWCAPVTNHAPAGNFRRQALESIPAPSSTTCKGMSRAPHSTLGGSAL